MKIKKSKHVHHDRGYTPVVNCKLTSRRLVCGTETDIQGVAVAVAHPQKVDIEQMAISAKGLPMKGVVTSLSRGNSSCWVSRSTSA